MEREHRRCPIIGSKRLTASWIAWIIGRPDSFHVFPDLLIFSIFLSTDRLCFANLAMACTSPRRGKHVMRLQYPRPVPRSLYCDASAGAGVLQLCVPHALFPVPEDFRRARVRCRECWRACCSPHHADGVCTAPFNYMCPARNGTPSYPGPAGATCWPARGPRA